MSMTIEERRDHHDAHIRRLFSPWLAGVPRLTAEQYDDLVENWNMIPSATRRAYADTCKGQGHADAVPGGGETNKLLVCVRCLRYCHVSTERIVA